MITRPQHHDNAYLKHPGDTLLRQGDHHRYYAEVPALSLDEQSQLIEQVVRFAFETLDACYLDVRVVDANQQSIAVRALRH